MKMKLLLESITLAISLTACGPNDFVSTENKTSPYEVAEARSGMQVTIRNNIPSIPAANGVPTVIHLNGELCSWTDTSPSSSNGSSTTSPSTTNQLTPLSECYSFSGTIHSGETETFLVSAAQMQRIYNASAGSGKVKFMFKSSAQSTYFFQGCVGSVVISSDFNQRRQMFDVNVQSQNSTWGYQCQITGN